MDKEANLTWREMEIVALLREHLSNAEIANRLHLSLNSVKWYIRQILGKLGVSNRREAVLRADVSGLFFEDRFDAEPAHSGNLPTPINALIGRNEVLIDLQEAILERDIRLITLTGAGGIGKTRLAIAAAWQVAKNFPDGAWLVDLASLMDPEQIMQTVLLVLGISASVGQANRQENGQDLSLFLKRKKLLLILDNCEHLLEASARLAQHLLQACPQLVILTTSREVLGIPGEVIFQVPPLSNFVPATMPGADVLGQSDAVQLFCERAEAVRKDFSLTAEDRSIAARICQRLDGIPLAIELAAAQVSMFNLTHEKCWAAGQLLTVEQAVQAALAITGAFRPGGLPDLNKRYRVFG